jgi:hypothetical protein
MYTSKLDKSDLLNLCNEKFNQTETLFQKRETDGVRIFRIRKNQLIFEGFFYQARLKHVGKKEDLHLYEISCRIQWFYALIATVFIFFSLLGLFSTNGNNNSTFVIRLMCASGFLIPVIIGGWIISVIKKYFILNIIRKLNLKIKKA